MTVEIRRLRFEREDTWQPPHDWTLVSVRPVSLTDASGRSEISVDRGATALIVGSPYINVVTGLGSLSWLFLLRIQPCEPSHSSLTHLA